MGTLPVFVTCRGNLRLDEEYDSFGAPGHWEDLRTFLFSGAGLEPVYLSTVAPLPRGPVDLPMKLVAIGLQAEDWVSKWRSEYWAQPPWGLQIHTARGDAAPLLRAVTPQIVVTEDPDRALVVAAELPEAHRPRLLIWMDETLGSPAPAVSRADVPGLAVLRLAGGGGRFISDGLLNVAMGIAHDQPLQNIANDVAAGGVHVRLVADAYSLHSLRLRTVLRDFRRQAREWEATNPAVVARNEVVQQWMTEARRSLTFFHEYQGFVPLSEMASKRIVAEAAFRSGPGSRHQPTRQGILPVASERFVQVILERLDGEPDQYLTEVEPSTALAVSRVYQVCLYIGSRSPQSLVESPPPIDPDLGPLDSSEGYNLEVVLQGKDFEVLSEPLQQLHLPRRGGSAPVYFEIRTPDSANAPAQLRICIFHGNHLAQSYILSAWIAGLEEGPVPPNAPLAVRLEMSRTKSIDQAAELAPRALSITVNASPNDTHDFVVKGSGASDSFSLEREAFRNSADKIRAILATAAEDPKIADSARVWPKVAKGGKPSADLAEVLRALAEWGHVLHGAFFAEIARRTPKLRAELVRLRRTKDERIQVARMAYDDAFHWPLLYDWECPTDDGAPVCLGWESKGKPCEHKDGDLVYCVRGFWGVRHQVEEILRGGQRVATLTAAPKAAPIRVIADASLPGGDSLASDLQSKLGTNVVANGPVPPVLIDLMFDDQQRPALLIVLGHHDRLARPGEVYHSRIQLDPVSGWLSEQDVSNRAGRMPQAWGSPNSLILLMACESAPTGDQALTNFVQTWITSGAGAVVGTETVVGTRLAADFAQRFTAQFWQDRKELGAVMSAVRAELVSEGNPLGFLFHAIGDLEMKVANS